MTSDPTHRRDVASTRDRPGRTCAGRRRQGVLHLARGVDDMLEGTGVQPFDRKDHPQTPQGHGTFRTRLRRSRSPVKDLLRRGLLHVQGRTAGEPP